MPVESRYGDDAVHLGVRSDVIDLQLAHRPGRHELRQVLEDLRLPSR